MQLVLASSLILDFDIRKQNNKKKKPGQTWVFWIFATNAGCYCRAIKYWSTIVKQAQLWQRGKFSCRLISLTANCRSRLKEKTEQGEAIGKKKSGESNVCKVFVSSQDTSLAKPLCHLRWVLGTDGQIPRRIFGALLLTLLHVQLIPARTPRNGSGEGGAVVFSW